MSRYIKGVDCPECGNVKRGFRPYLRYDKDTGTLKPLDCPLCKGTGKIKQEYV